VRLRIIPEQATQIAELISGGVDVIKAGPPDQMDVINKSGQTRVVTSPILRTAMIKLDQPARNGKNPMEDRRVRQAANLAVDMDAIIKHVLNGLGDRTATAANPMAFGFDPSLQPYKQDIPRARSSWPTPDSRTASTSSSTSARRSSNPAPSRPARPWWPTWRRPASARSRTTSATTPSSRRASRTTRPRR
jgi:ABC-type oligopeptide transport system substrate-binding subunit